MALYIKRKDLVFQYVCIVSNNITRHNKNENYKSFFE